MVFERECSAQMKKQEFTKKLIGQLFAENRLALARVITKIENRDPEIPNLMKLLYPKTGKAQIYGITGPPGAGKSTLVDRLVALLRSKNKKVAVVAVDPSSPFSGGAILGDRIRMQQHASDEGVFIRSLGTRGKHGGLSHATKEVVWALDAAKFDVILVETAGVGQTELEILKLAQTVVVVLVPESGDSIQVMKAGLMEIANVFAVNKSDRAEADQLVKELVNMVGLEVPGQKSEGWKNPVCKTEAVRDRGVVELLNAIEQHQKYLSDSKQRTEKVRAFVVDEVSDILNEKVGLLFDNFIKSKAGSAVIQNLLKKKTDPYSVSTDIFKKISRS